MNELLEYKRFMLNESITAEKIEELSVKFNSTQGIDKFKCTLHHVSFIYNPYEISENEIVKMLSVFGITIKTNKPYSFRARLAKLAKDNNENFGGKRLGCCDLND